MNYMVIYGMIKDQIKKTLTNIKLSNDFVTFGLEYCNFKNY